MGLRWAAGSLAIIVMSVGAILLHTGDQPFEAHRAVLVTSNEPQALITESNSPSVARNPRRAGNLVGANRVDRPAFSASLHWTVDEGESWHRTALPLPAGQDRPYAPDLAFAPDGTLYVTYVNLSGPGNSPDALWLARSTDGGRTLGGPVRVASGFTFQSRLAVDRQGAIDVTWLQAESVGTLSLTGPPSPIVMSRSTDEGRTFSPPVRVSDGQRVRVGAATPVIDSDGGIVVLYEDFKADARDFENLEGPPWDQPFALVVTRSADGGRTFSPGVEIETDVVASERFLVYLPVFPSIAAAQDGRLYVSWSDSRHGLRDVLLRRSSDLGRTWTNSERPTTGPDEEPQDRWMPQVTAAPDGRVDLLFLAGRATGPHATAAPFLATSNDRAQSFRTGRVSTASFNPTIGTSAATHLPPDLGSRMAVLSDNSGALAMWTDSRLGSLDTGRQDILAARISISEGRLGWPVLLLVAGGVLLVGSCQDGRVARLLGSRMRRRRSRSTGCTTSV